MLGLFFFAIVGLWIFISTKLSVRFFRNTKPIWKRGLFTIVSMVLLFIAPVTDEVVGGVQFYGLCKKYGRKEAQFAAIEKSTVSVELIPFEKISGTILKVSAGQMLYRDVSSKEVVLRYREYRTEGGWLIHALGFFETNGPLLFPRECGPSGDESVQGWLDRYGIKTKFDR